MSQLLDKVPDVDIDDHGRFKYILINVRDEVNEASKPIVRGYARAQWHGESMLYSILDIFATDYVTYMTLNILLNF